MCLGGRDWQRSVALPIASNHCSARLAEVLRERVLLKVNCFSSLNRSRACDLQYTYILASAHSSTHSTPPLLSGFGNLRKIFSFFIFGRLRNRCGLFGSVNPSLTNFFFFFSFGLSWLVRASGFFGAVNLSLTFFFSFSFSSVSLLVAASSFLDALKISIIFFFSPMLGSITTAGRRGKDRIPRCARVGVVVGSRDGNAGRNAVEEEEIAAAV